jgi:hypothetical protein
VKSLTLPAGLEVIISSGLGLPVLRRGSLFEIEIRPNFQKCKSE